MSNEEKLKQALVTRLGLPLDKVEIRRERRVFAEIGRERLLEIINILSREMGYDSLCTMTGQDEGENLSFMYHLCHASGIVLTLKVYVPRTDPQLPTVSGVFPSAVLYEREGQDLLGFKIEGLPAEGSRYPLVDDWPQGQYPLRKDWNPEILDQIDCQHKM